MGKEGRRPGGQEARWPGGSAYWAKEGKCKGPETRVCRDRGTPEGNSAAQAPQKGAAQPTGPFSDMFWRMLSLWTSVFSPVKIWRVIPITLDVWMISFQSSKTELLYYTKGPVSRYQICLIVTLIGLPRWWLEHLVLGFSYHDCVKGSVNKHLRGCAAKGQSRALVPAWLHPPMYSLQAFGVNGRCPA